MSLKSLPLSVKKHNNYLTESHHGIDYFDGDCSARLVKKALRNLSKNTKKIFVRGNQKFNFLSNIVARDIINVENWEDCPSFSNLPWVETHCLLHGTKNSYVRFTCALNNALRLKRWLKDRITLSSKK